MLSARHKHWPYSNLWLPFSMAIDFVNWISFCFMKEIRIMKTHICYPAEKNSKSGLAFTFLCALCVLCGKDLSSPARGQEKSDANHLKDTVREINDRVNGQLESLQTLYKSIHTHPELSLQEEHT